jgi:hypothetical protein
MAMGMARASLSAAGPPDQILTVRVYQTAGLSSAIERRSLEEAARVLRPALVTVRWRWCTGPNPAPACDRPLVRAELLLRIVRRAVVHHGTAMALGTALVAPGRGVLATVYVGHIEELSTATRTDPAVLLGRATAHEIGHLLIRNAGHAPCGVMRERWTEQEVRRNHPLDWMFTAGDVVAIHRFWAQPDLPAGEPQRAADTWPSAASISFNRPSISLRRPTA